MSQRRKIIEYEQAAHAMKPSELMPIPEPEPVPMVMHQIAPSPVVPAFLSPREAALSEQLAGAQKALMSMQVSQRDLKAELERWKNRTKLAEERNSPSKAEIPRRTSKKMLLIGPPAAMLPRPRTALLAGSTDEPSRDDDVRARLPYSSPINQVPTSLAQGDPNGRPCFAVDFGTCRRVAHPPPPHVTSWRRPLLFCHRL